MSEAGMQLAAAVAAHGQQREPSGERRVELLAPGDAQQQVDELRPGAHQHLDRFLGEEALLQLFLRLRDRLAEGGGRVLLLGELRRQALEQRPVERGRRSRRSSSSRLEGLKAMGSWDIRFSAGPRRRGSSTSKPVCRDEHRVLPLRRERVVLGDHGPAVAQQPHVCRLPALIIGSIVKVMPGRSTTPVSGSP